MTDANPYKSPAEGDGYRRSAIPGRATVLAIHIALLFAVLLGGPLLSVFIGPRASSGTLETDLSGSDDFFRAFANYSFVLVMLVLLLDFPVYVAVRYWKGRPTRWTWLGWTTALIPVASIVYYFALWPTVRIPTEI